MYKETELKQLGETRASQVVVKRIGGKGNSKGEELDFDCTT